MKAGTVSRKNNVWAEAALLAACFVALRLLVLWTGIERVSHNDELDLGTMAKEILSGLKMPYRDYQLDFYSGESLVLGLAAVPFFKLIGMNLIALKMVPLVFSFLTAAAGWVFLRRYFGETAGTRGGWLLVFCPASFVQLSLVGMTGHSEALLWSVISVLFFYEYFTIPVRRPAFAAAAGFFAGFGFWFYYACGIMTAACLLAWLIRDRRGFFGKGLAVLTLGFAAGASPWIFFNWHYVPGFFASLGESSGHAGTGLEILKKEYRIFAAGLPNAFAFYPGLGIPAHILSGLVFVVFFLPAAVWGMVHSRNPKVLPLALYVPVFAAVVTAVHFDLQRDFGFVGYRYLTPLIYFTVLLFAVMVSRVRAGKAVWAAALVLGAAGQCGLLFAEPPGRGLHYQGFSYYQLGVRLEFSVPGPVKTRAGFEKLAASFPENERNFFIWGFEDASVMEGRRDFLEYAPARTGFLQPGIEKGKEAYLKWLEGKQDAFAELETLDAEQKIWAWRGAGYLFLMHEGIYPKRTVKETLASDFLKQAGNRMPEIFWGMGWAFTEFYREDRQRAEDWVRRLPVPGRTEAFKGMEAFRKAYGAAA